MELAVSFLLLAAGFAALVKWADFFAYLFIAAKKGKFGDNNGETKKYNMWQAVIASLGSYCYSLRRGALLVVFCIAGKGKLKRYGALPC